MTTLKDTLAYVLKHYPPSLQSELSNARVTKMIYLADWHQAIKYNRQITGINWFFDNYGPFVNDVKVTAEADKAIFGISNVNNMHGQPKLMLSLKDQSFEPNVDEKAKDSLDHVIELTRKLYWDKFIKLVYSTYPIVTSDRYSELDLVKKADEYRTQNLSLE